MITTASPAKRCAATNRRGEPCQAWAGNGSDLCFWHDPARAKDRAKARSDGGKARHGRRIIINAETGQSIEAVALENAGDVVELIERAVNDVLILENSNTRGKVIASLATVALKALETASLEDRLSAMEQQLIALTEETP